MVSGAERDAEFLRLLATDRQVQNGLRKACAILNQNPALRDATLRVGPISVTARGVGVASGDVAGATPPATSPAEGPVSAAPDGAEAEVLPPVVDADGVLPSSAKKKKMKKKAKQPSSAATGGGAAAVVASPSPPSTGLPTSPVPPPDFVPSSGSVSVDAHSCSAVVAPAAGDKNAGKICAEIVKFIRAYVKKTFFDKTSSPRVPLADVKFSFPNDSELFVVSVPADSEAAHITDLGSRLLAAWSSDCPVRDRKAKISFLLDPMPNGDDGSDEGA